KTIAKYVAAAVALGLQRDAPPLNEEQITAVIAAVRATGGRPAAVPDRLVAHRDQIAAWLAGGVRLAEIHPPPPGPGRGIPHYSPPPLGPPPFGRRPVGLRRAPHHRPRRRPATRRSGRSRFRFARALARSRARAAPTRLGAAGHAVLQPLRVPLDHPAPGPARRPGRAGGRLVVL